MNEILLAVFWYILLPIFSFLTLHILIKVFSYLNYVVHFIKDSEFYIVHLEKDNEYRLFGVNTDFLYLRGSHVEVKYLYDAFMSIKEKSNNS